MAKVSSSNPQVARAAFLKACVSEYGPGLQSAPTWRQDTHLVAAFDVFGASYGRPRHSPECSARWPRSRA